MAGTILYERSIAIDDFIRAIESMIHISRRLRALKLYFFDLYMLIKHHEHYR